MSKRKNSRHLAPAADQFPPGSQIELSPRAGSGYGRVVGAPQLRDGRVHLPVAIRLRPGGQKKPTLQWRATHDLILIRPKAKVRFTPVEAEWAAYDSGLTKRLPHSTRPPGFKL